MITIRQSKDREIAKVIDPTVAAFAPLLKMKKAHIKEIPFKTFKYTSTRDDRAELDIYYPPTPQPNHPVLFFIYGGGFNTGEKSISPKSFGLVYANLAAFFSRHGYTVIIPDYRLVPHITFPSPAHDIRDALHWLIQNPQSLLLNSDSQIPPLLDNIFILAHSAGAAHTATMLFLTDVLPKSDPLRQKIKAVVLESPPYDLSAMTTEWPTAEIHAKYWVTLENAKQNDPWHLFKRLDDETVATLPSIMMLEGEFEPDWLIDARKVFRNEVRERTGEDLKLVIAKGHNHISMNWALSSGEGEEWAEEVLEWFDKVKTEK